jgi:hypothetical protein
LLLVVLCAGASPAVLAQAGGQGEKVFDALEWLAAMSLHVSDKGEQMVRVVSSNR